MNFPAQRIHVHLGRLLAAWAAIAGLTASEYRGSVKAVSLPLPGVTVTATQGDKKIVATTDDRGQFRFAELTDGHWTIEVQMLGFASVARQIDIMPGSTPGEWELKFLSENALLATLNSNGELPSAPPGRNLPEPAAGMKAEGPPQRGNRSNPSGRPAPDQRGGFQRLAVNQSAETVSLSSEGAIRNEEIADLSQTAANSFIVQGSVSSAQGLGPQDDWGPRMGMGFPGGPGMGGPGMGPGGDSPGGGEGGPRGAGGPGGGPPAGGGPGGPGGGGFGGGFRPGGGGPGGPGGGPGGPGGFGGGSGGPGGRGGPPWQGLQNARAFGNGRRDPRNMYMVSAFFNLDNSALDARTFSVTGANLDKPAYANGRGSITLGGPLRIPKLVSVEKRILFTLNYDFQRNRTGTTSNPVNMPTALERSGDFSQTLLQGAPVAIYDPATGLPFPGAKIPGNLISSTATGLLGYFPNPNLPFAARNYQTSLNGSNNTQNLNSRISNIRFGAKDRLNFGMGYQRSSSVTPNLFQFIDTGAGRGINTTLGWSRSITPRLTNNVQYTFSRMRQELNPYFANRQNVASDLGILGTSQEPVNWGPPSLSFTNYGGLTDGNFSLNRNQTSSVGESLAWTRGEHNFTFGGDYRRQQFNQLADTNGRGAYSFNGSATGYDLADFLLGLPTTASLRFGNADKYFRGSGYDAFVNDDWRISPRLSLIFGLRWEYGTPVTELYNRLVNLAVASDFSSITATLPGQNSLPDSLIHPDRNNFSPRAGLAWRPLAKGSLVVRAGYGVYYNTSVYNQIAGNMAQQPPFAESLSVSSSAANLLSIQDGFLLASSRANTGTYAVNPNYRIGYAQTWNLSVQRDLPLSMFGTIGYLGTKGTRLDQQFIPNSVAPGAVESSLPHGYIYETSNGNSIYHAAQFQLNRRFHNGIMWRGSYQFSKSIDNAGTGGRGQGNTPVAQNWFDLSAERGLSSFDARHNLSLQVQYSTGMGVDGGSLLNSWKGTLFKDWTIGGNVNVRSGNPFTATVGGARSQVSGTAVSNVVRADATGLPIDAEGMLFNTAAFAAPLAGTWGDAGRNTIPGPTVFSLDSSLGRIFRLGERRSVDFQAQSQNVLNHVTITGWGTALNSNTYGLASNAAGMRKISLSLRFRF